ncbi:hypothetical protein [Paenibacillus dendritiformis]|uniref:hypothetical protein n=1 Tax=Paenibacillus dendritiformis TaxID=130049 RepID=UPI000DA78B6F|nr:hypothetical protein [Paenibacillus dendritiformis]PZM62587.1 hypothetical protein DOE73_26380 [Paenibacillus dendritiformis]
MKKPQKVTDLEMAFGGDMKKLLPAMSEIPEEFTSLGSKWCKLISDWFYIGLSELKAQPREGIDTQEAFRHIRAILGSFEPKHEHKIACCAYLMSLWFEDEFSYKRMARA